MKNEIVRCEGNRCVIDTPDGLKVVEKIEKEVPAKQSIWSKILNVFAFLIVFGVVKGISDEMDEEENFP